MDDFRDLGVGVVGPPTFDRQARTQAYIRARQVERRMTALRYERGARAPASALDDPDELTRRAFEENDSERRGALLDQALAERRRRHGG